MRTQILLEKVAVRLLDRTRIKLDLGLMLEHLGAMVLEDEMGHVAYVVVENRGVVLQELWNMDPRPPQTIIATFQEPGRPGHLLVAIHSLSEGWNTHWIPLHPVRRLGAATPRNRGS
jgi:hypothetical protein